MNTNTKENTLIVGMGKSGLSMARHMLAHGYAVHAVDNRAQPPHADSWQQLANDLQSCTRGVDYEKWDADYLCGFARICKSPGVSLSVLSPLLTLNAEAKSESTQQKIIVGDADLFSESWRRQPLTTSLLAITGTNGKSTTAELVVAMCRAAGLSAEAVGNIGEPLLDALARWRAQGAPQVAAVELSSFQLELAPAFPAAAAVVLNVSADHLDRHESLDDYAQIKSYIYESANVCVVNGDDKNGFALSGNAIIYAKKRKENNLMKTADFYVEEDCLMGGGMRIPLAALSSQVPIENALAAMALVSPLQLSQEAISTALANFVGLPHRMQTVLHSNNVQYINDSKATNVESACFALRRLQNMQKNGKVILIAGGDGKGQDFVPLAEAACGAVRCAVLLGQDSKNIADAFKISGIEHCVVHTLAQAVQQAHQIAQVGDVILLSPACSSLDMYANYAARGDDFVAACHGLVGMNQNDIHATAVGGGVC